MTRRRQSTVSPRTTTCWRSDSAIAHRIRLERGYVLELLTLRGDAMDKQKASSDR